MNKSDVLLSSLVAISYNKEKKNTPGWVRLVVNLSASHKVGHGLAPWSSHIKDHHKNGTNCPPAGHAGARVGVSQCKPTV